MPLVWLRRCAPILGLGLQEMVTTATLITMSGGRPVAVVLSTEEYERLARGQAATDRWRALLERSAEIRDEGGAALDIPARMRRASPFGRTRS